MITADKGYVVQTMKEQYTQDCKQHLQQDGYFYHSIMNYINLYELLECYPILTISKLTITDFYVFRTMILDHMKGDREVDRKCRQNLKQLENYP